MFQDGQCRTLKKPLKSKSTQFLKQSAPIINQKSIQKKYPLLKQIELNKLLNPKSSRIAYRLKNEPTSTPLGIHSASEPNSTESVREFHRTPRSLIAPTDVTRQLLPHFNRLNHFHSEGSGSFQYSEVQWKKALSAAHKMQDNQCQVQLP